VAIRKRNQKSQKGVKIFQQIELLDVEIVRVILNFLEDFKSFLRLLVAGSISDYTLSITAEA
jgi:hypothetical protein